jgi:hypothetical protein
MSTGPGSSHSDAQLDRIETTLTRLDEKLDNHLERIAVAESNIAWLRSHVRNTTAVFIAVVGFLSAALFNSLWGGK